MAACDDTPTALAISGFLDNMGYVHTWVETDALTATTPQGKSRTTLEGYSQQIESAIVNTGWFAAAGGFEAGGTITERNQYLQLVTTAGDDVAGGYTWGGALPKVVPPGSTPATTGGTPTDGTGWVYRGETTVRAALADGTVSLGGRAVIPELFGAVAGLNASNHTALKNMILDGRPIDWGNKSYGITEPIKGDGDTALVVAHALKWTASGAEVYLDSASTQQRAVVWLEVAGLDHEIDGQLIIDGNDKANRGFWAEYKTAVFAGSFYAKNLTARNLRRTLDFTGGDGILIEGGFKSVVLESPKVSNVTMAVGAGIEGSQGIRGIGVVRDAVGLYPLYTHISNPDVDTIISEDLAYNWDQDAIAIFGGIESGDTPSFAHVEGGTLKNQGGRGVKCQTTDGLVGFVTFIRDTGLTTPKDPEVDFLYGGGTITNCQHVYDDTAPPELYAGASATTDNTPALQIKGGKVTLLGTATLDRICTLFARKANYGQPIVADIEIVGGSVDEYALIRVADANTTMTLQNLSANVLTQGFSVLATTGSGQACRVTANNLNNSGSSVPLYAHRVSGSVATAIVSASNCNKGWSGSGGQLDSTSANAPIVSVVPIWQGNYDRCGSAKMFGQRINSAADFSIPLLATSNVSIVMINVGGVAGLNALISTSSAGPVLLAGGADFNVGTTSDPGSGNYRLWVDTVTGSLVYKTALATTRAVTALVFGS